MMRAVLRAALAAAVLTLVLVQPSHPAGLNPAAIAFLPLELPAILLALLALASRGPVTAAVRAGIVFALTLSALLKLANFATVEAYGRSFNPVADLHLVPAAFRLGSGAVGLPMALLAVIVAVAGIVALASALWWATGVWSAPRPPQPLWRGALAGGAALAAAAVVVDVGVRRGMWDPPLRPPGQAFTTRVVLDRVDLGRRTYAELRRFAAAARQDDMSGRDGLLDRLAGRDVLIVFLESYGRASLDVPYYAERHRPTLRQAEAAVEAAGLAARSGWLTAPMVGGQSWLAHSTIASGLWIPDQVHYRAYLASPRRSLYHIAAEAGYRTAAVMPAITYDWPEGPLMGFDTILSSHDLGYEGPPFNWVTMPDQFTLDAAERLLRSDPGGLFAQIALVSSHAPWTPIPELLPWDAIGDGSVFDRWKDAGDPPSVVWADPERVRAQYRAAIDYTLSSVFSYAAERAEGGPLLVIAGDHQTAPRISGSDSFDVPVHVVGPPEVVSMLGDWGWTAGLVPEADVPAMRMDLFRDRFLETFSSGTPRSDAGPDIRF